MSQRDDMALEHSARVRGSGLWRRTTCGWCEERGLGFDRRGNWCLNTASGYFHCWRCSVRGYLPGYSPPEDLDDATAPIAGIAPPEGYMPLSARGEGLTRARRYVLGRGISRETALRAHLGACLRGPFAGRIVVPILDAEDQRWVGWSARLFMPPRYEHTPKYRYPEGMPRARIVYNEAAIHADTDRPLLVVEGVFDALPYYPDAVALLGKPSPAQLDLLCVTTRPIVVALDGDAWLEGYWLAEQLKFRGDVQATALKLPPREDPCSLGAAWIENQVASIFGIPSGKIVH